LTTPDTPISITEYLPSRTVNSIGIQFSVGLSNGGASVLDYTITYTYGNVTTVQSGITQSPYTATGLVTGQTYVFTV
jgi:hypothetical protein